MKRFSRQLFPFSIIIILVISGCSETPEEVNLCNGSLEVQDVEVFESFGGQSNGSITAEATGGSAPYSYSLDGVNFNQSGSFIDLSTGSYQLTVKDKNECVAEVSVFVSEQALVSYSKNIVPILVDNCMISGCHCDGNSLCFDTFENVTANSRGIKDRTSSRAMPPSYSGKVLTDIQITDIANWVYQGMPNN